MIWTLETSYLGAIASCRADAAAGGSDGDGDGQDEADWGYYDVGMRVHAHSLSAQEYNGRSGFVIQDLRATSGRLRVRLEPAAAAAGASTKKGGGSVQPKDVNLKPANLKPENAPGFSRDLIFGKPEPLPPRVRRATTAVPRGVEY